MTLDLKQDDEFFTQFNTQVIFFNKEEILKALKEVHKGIEQKVKKQEPKEIKPEITKEQIKQLIKEVKKELKPEKIKKTKEKQEESQIKEIKPEETIIDIEYNRLIEQQYAQQLDYSNLFSYLSGSTKVNKYENPFEEKKEDKSGFMNEEDAGKIVETIAKQQAINSGEYVKPEDKEKFELYVKLRWDIVNMKMKHTAYGNVNINMDKINY